ncbi:MAG: DUF4012 domain-containing protein, partial [Actinomycetota bacterium]|nr:DUF4012 domain-containing protein [Actinomycetota bacterium]
EAGAKLERGEKSLSGTALKEAQDQIFAGLAATRRAREGLEGPGVLLDLALLSDRAAGPVGDLDHLVEAAKFSGKAAQGSLRIAKNALRGPSRIIKPDPDDPEGGSVIELERIEEVGLSVAKVRANLDGVQRELEQIDLDELPGRVRKKVTEGLASAREAEAVIADAQAGFEILPDILGAGGPRTYLIGMQNPAEQRGTGGAILRYSYLEIDDGRPHLKGGGSVYDIDKERELLDIDLPKDAWYVKAIDDAQRFGNANWSPDWPLSAELMLDYAYAADKSPKVTAIPRFDGVITLDPVVMQKVLPGAGGFKLHGTGARLTATRAVHYLLYKAYASFPQKGERRAALIDVVKRFEQAMLDPLHPTETVTGMGDALRTKHIQVWMRDPQEQTFVKRMDWDGSLRPTPQSDYLMWIEQNVGGNKFDYFTDHSTTADIEITDEGDAVTSTQLTISNETFFPQTLHAMGDSGARTATGQRRTPTHEPMMNLYVPRRAELTDADVASGRECSATKAIVTRSCRVDSPEVAAWSGNRPPEHFELDKRVWTATVAIPPQEEGVMRFDYRVEDVVQAEEDLSVYRLVLQHQPRVRPEIMEIRLRLPEGASEVVARGFTREGDDLVWSRPLQEDLELEVSWQEG